MTGPLDIVLGRKLARSVVFDHATRGVCCCCTCHNGHMDNARAWSPGDEQRVAPPQPERCRHWPAVAGGKPPSMRATATRTAGGSRDPGNLGRASLRSGVLIPGSSPKTRTFARKNEFSTVNFRSWRAAFRSPARASSASMPTPGIESSFHVVQQLLLPEIYPIGVNHKAHDEIRRPRLFRGASRAIFSFSAASISLPGFFVIHSV